MSHKLVLTGSVPLPAKIINKKIRKREDLWTYHEEADVIIIQQMAELAKSGAKSICLVSVYFVISPLLETRNDLQDSNTIYK